MSEQEWLTCTDEPGIMLGLAEDQIEDEAILNRKARLFACACARQVWHLLIDPRSRHAVEVAERYADGAATGTEAEAAFADAIAATEDLAVARDAAAVHGLTSPERVTAGKAWYVSQCGYLCVETNGHIPQWAGLVATHSGWEPAPSEEAGKAILAAQCDLLREIFGNPFSPVQWSKQWQDPTVTKLAEVIYRDQKFEDMIILSDALEDAGCDEPEILSHCRGDSRHVPGCWLIDRIRGCG